MQEDQAMHSIGKDTLGAIISLRSFSLAVVATRLERFSSPWNIIIDFFWALCQAYPEKSMMAVSARFERATPAFGGQYSIQLSYETAWPAYNASDVQSTQRMP